MSTGSLGQGLSSANGMAIAGKLDKKEYRVYCILGDGELEEGQIWEAAMTSKKNKLDNLCVIVDNNNLQIDGTIQEVKNLYQIDEKFKSFGFEVIKIDGHNIEEIIKALEKAKTIKRKTNMHNSKNNKRKRHIIYGKSSRMARKSPKSRTIFRSSKRTKIKNKAKLVDKQVKTW